MSRQVPLLQAFTPPEGQALRAAVLTTFDFDLPYFERTLLPTLVGLGMDAPDRETAANSMGASPFLLALRDRLRKARVVVLADKGRFNFQQEKSCESYDVMFARRFRAFHPKLYMLAFDKTFRMIVGSANLTEAAFHRNLEGVWMADSDHDGQFGHAANDGLDFIARITRKEWPGSRVIDEALRLLRRSIPRKGGQARLLHSEHRQRQPILRQWIAHMRSAPLDELHVVSPFFDGGDRLKPATILRASATHLYVRKESFDGKPVYRLPISRRAMKALRPLCEVISPAWIAARGGDPKSPPPRVLHAKLFAARSRGRGWALIGSPNFTAPALLGGNAEVAVALAGKWSEVRRLLPPSAGRVEYQQVAQSPPSDEETGQQWTPFVTTAEYDPESKRVDLSFEERMPAGAWSVAYEGKVLAAGAPRRRFPRRLRAPLALSDKAWLDISEGRRRFKFPIAVVNKEMLPTLPGIENLDYDDLLDYLARGATNLAKFRERILQKKATGQHKGTDDQVAYMERLSRLTRALEGLRRRLSAPMVTLGEAKALFLGDLGVRRIVDGILADRGIDDAFRKFALLEINGVLSAVRWRGSADATAEAKRLARIVRGRVARNTVSMRGLQRLYLKDGGKGWVR